MGVANLKTLLSLDIPIWVLIPAAEVAFVIYDYAFTKVSAYYFPRIRRSLMKD